MGTGGEPMATGGVGRGTVRAVALGLPLLLGACSALTQPQQRLAGALYGHLAAPRSTEDRPDVSDGHQIHVIYAVPSDVPDGALDTTGVIAASVATLNDWFEKLSGGRRLLFDLTEDGRLDVSYVALPRTQGELAAAGPFLRDEIEAHINALGFSHPRKLYLVYYDGGSSHACGGAPYGPALPGNTVALYLRGRTGEVSCNRDALLWANAVGYWERAALHDLLHALGFVAACAPNHRRFGHVGDSHYDLMYAGPSPWNPLKLDVNNDDYFNHGRADCPDLARSAFLDPPAAGANLPPRWNMGHDDSVACTWLGYGRASCAGELVSMLAGAAVPTGTSPRAALASPAAIGRPSIRPRRPGTG